MTHEETIEQLKLENERLQLKNEQQANRQKFILAALAVVLPAIMTGMNIWQERSTREKIDDKARTIEATTLQTNADLNRWKAEETDSPVALEAAQVAEARIEDIMQEAPNKITLPTSPP